MISPDIPKMDPMRVQVRKHALMNEISTKPSRRWWRIAVPVTALAMAAVGIVLWIPTAPSAYATWTAEPRAPGADGEAAIKECWEAVESHSEHGRRENLPNWPATPTEVSVVDQRGSMTIALFTGPGAQMECTRTPDGVGLAGGGSATSYDPLEPEELFRSYGASMRSERDGSQPMRILSAMVAPQVGKVEVHTADGLKVTATVGKDWMLAWWPSAADATSVTLYDKAGTVLKTQPVGLR